MSTGIKTITKPKTITVIRDIVLQRLPLALLVLGVTSIGLIAAVDHISRSMRQAFLYTDVVHEMQIELSKAHLALEENLSGIQGQDIAPVWQGIDRTEEMASAALGGGQTLHGYRIKPLQDDSLRKNMERLRSLTVRFRELARNVYINSASLPEINSMNSVYHQFLEQAFILDEQLERIQAKAEQRSKKLILLILISWTGIIGAAIAGLWYREMLGRRMQATILSYRNRLEELVDQRTNELAGTNETLRMEVLGHEQTAEALQLSENRFRQLSQQFNVLLDAMPDSLVLMSPDLKVKWANKSALQARIPEKVQGSEYCYTLWHKQDRPCDDCPVLKSFRSGNPEADQLSTADNRLWAVRAYPILNERGEIESVMEISTDITEKKSIQAEQIRSNHLASIGELAAGVAHEINNPINGIINYAQIIVNSAEPESREYDVAKRIIKEGERISFIVTSLLSFARERKEEKIPITVRQILSDALALTEMQLKKSGITLRRDIDPDIPFVKVHAQQIQQVFLNIINNARYALSQKYPQPDPDKVFLISAGETIVNGEPFVEIVFEDHGIGIPESHIDKVMNPFYTTKPVGLGTGLGLSISHGIIVDHGGRLTVESKEGAYTRIIVSLPAYKETS